MREHRSANETSDTSVTVPTGPDAVLALRPGLKPMAVGDGLVVVHAKSGKSTALNAGAALIATSFDGFRDVADVARELAAEAGVDLDVMLHDVLTLAAELRTRGVLRQVDGTACRFDRAVVGGLANVRVRTDFEAVADLLAPLLASMAESDHAEHELVVTFADGFYATFEDGDLVATSPTVEHAVVSVLRLLNTHVLHDSVGTIRLHAGAVARNGRALVLVGESGRGKSTLTASLVRRGWEYLSDEVAIVDTETRTVLPYAKALDLDDHACHLAGIAKPDVNLGARKSKVLPASLGDVGAGDAKLELIVLVDEHPDRLDPVAALVQLLAGTFAPTAEDPRCLDALARIAEEIPVVGIRRGTPDDMVASVAELVAHLQQ